MRSLIVPARSALVVPDALKIPQRFRAKAPAIARRRPLLAAPIPSFGARGSFTTANNSASPSYPTGITAGQKLIVSAWGFCLTAGQDVLTWTGPAGFTTIHEGTGSRARSAAWEKTATGSETGTVTVSATTGSGNVAIDACVMRFANAGNFTVEGVDENFTASVNTSLVPADLTTLGPNRLAVALCYAGNAAVPLFFDGPISGNSGGSWSEADGIASVTTGHVNSRNVADMPSPGTLSGGAITLSSSSRWSVITFAILPAVVGLTAARRSFPQLNR